MNMTWRKPIYPSEPFNFMLALSDKYEVEAKHDIEKSVLRNVKSSKKVR